MDHHGLVAAVCKDLGIAEKINSRTGAADERRIVTISIAAVAMIFKWIRIYGGIDLDKEIYPDQQMLNEYKRQQNVEGGFRFVKNPVSNQSSLIFFVLFFYINDLYSPYSGTGFLKMSKAWYATNKLRICKPCE